MASTIDQIAQHKIIAIIRGADPAAVLKIAEALYAGGIRLVEITMNSSKPLTAIEQLSYKMEGKMLIGAGTVLDAETAAEAIMAGAQFILSPIVDIEVIGAARDKGIVVIPGAHTPTEIVHAFKNGGDIIKVFPATSPGYIKNILGPLPHVPLLPTGGVNLENIQQYKQAGAVGFGIGSSLVNTAKEVTDQYLIELTETAKKYVQAIADILAFYLKPIMDKFLSCDWGTSFFRLRLVEYETLQIIAEEKNDNGIAVIFNLWKEQGADAGKRQAVYQSVIIRSIQLLSERLRVNLDGVPVIISGMISSSIGMIDLPYKQTPVAIDGSNLEIKRLLIEGSKNEFIIISGIKTTDDVIRGEETKIVGCAPYFDGKDNEQLLVFAGTHPKHVTIKNKQVTGIKTYMTGEFFNLLVNHSVLAASVKAGSDFYESANQADFKQGVQDSISSNLLQAAFGVRINDLLKNIPKENNYYYLSGLLIGTELKDLLNYTSPVYLCAGTDLIQYYKSAFDILGINVSAQIDADGALLNGQKLIVSRWL